MVCGEGCFSLFYGQLFSLFSPLSLSFFFAHNGLSLPGLILFMILEEEVMEVEKVEEGEVGHDEL